MRLVQSLFVLIVIWFPPLVRKAVTCETMSLFHILVMTMETIATLLMCLFNLKSTFVPVSVETLITFVRYGTQSMLLYLSMLVEALGKD